MQSFDGSVDETFKAFKETKTLYVILHKETDDSRHSAVTDRNYSTTNPDMIKDIENAINTMMQRGSAVGEPGPSEKRHSSVCESLRSLRERRLRESMESPRFGLDSRNSSVYNKKNSAMLPNDLNDELELAYTAANIKKIFDK